MRGFKHLVVNSSIYPIFIQWELNLVPTLLPIYYTGYPNLIYFHSFLHNYPFLIIPFLYFTLQVYPYTSIMVEPCPHPAMVVKGCNASLLMGVLIVQLRIFSPQGPHPSVHYTSKNMANIYGGFKSCKLVRLGPS